MKNINKITLVILTFAFTAGVSFAEGIALSLKDAVNLAVKASNDVKIQKQKYDKMFNSYKAVKASIYPQVSGGFSWDRYIKSPVLNIDMGNGPVSIPLKQDWEMAASVTANQVLWAFGKVMTAIEIAHNALDLEKAGMSVVENELSYGVKVTYITMLYARETVKIAEGSHANALKNKEALNNTFGGGRVSKFNNIKMEADVAGRVPSVMKAKSALSLVESALKDMLDIDNSAIIIASDSLTEDFPVYNYAELKSRIEAEPVLGLLRKNIALNNSIMRLRKTDNYPTLAGYTMYGYSGNSNDVIPSDVMQAQWVAGIRLNMTIFDSGARANEYRKAVNDKTMAELEYNKKLDALGLELLNTINEYNDLIETYKANKTAQKLAEDAYAVTLASFKSGSVSLTVLNDAELGLTGAKMGTLASLYNINMLIAKIEKLVSAAGAL